MAPAGGWVTRASDRLEVSHGAGWPMLQLSGAELRRRREQLGLTIEQVSVGTGLTRDALAALEGDQSHRLTRGAYGDAYRKTYTLFLDRVESGDTAVPPTSTEADIPSTWSNERTARGGASDIAEAEREVAAPELRPARVPLPAVRAVAAVTTLGLVALLGWQATRELRESDGAGGPPGIEVKLKLQRNAHLRVEVDGKQVLDRELAGREEASFAGRERVAIDVPSSDVLRVWFNGRPIEPRGQLGRPRTLVFLPGGEELR
jgi:transcriptional regulator with XRE-family HTH domain